MRAAMGHDAFAQGRLLGNYLYTYLQPFYKTNPIKLADRKLSQADSAGKAPLDDMSRTF